MTQNYDNIVTSPKNAVFQIRLNQVIYYGYIMGIVSIDKKVAYSNSHYLKSNQQYRAYHP